MESIRVLQVIGALNSGGMESVVMNYYRHMDRSAVQFDFLVFAGRSFYDDEVERLGGRIYRLPPMKKNPVAHRRELDRFFREHPEYRIVQIHQGILNLTPLRMAAKNGVPVRIVHSHGIDGWQLRHLNLYRKWYAKPVIARLSTDHFVCSPTIADHILSDAIVRRQDYVYVKNAVDTGNFRFDPGIREKKRKELGLDGRFVVGHVGRFADEKNHRFLLEIFAQVHRLCPEAVLLLAGKGPLEEAARRQAEESGLSDAVRFLGVRSDVHELMQAMDVFVLPSLFEGLPVVGVEAQAAGLEFFMSDHVSSETAITDLAHTLPLETPAPEWAEAIVQYRGAPRRDMTEEIRWAGFDISAQARRLQDFYLSRMKMLDRTGKREIS